MPDASTSQDIHQHRILILDFGSQYTQLIARRIREVGVYCEIHPHDISRSTFDDFAPRGVILSGGPESVTADETLTAPDFIFAQRTAASVPVLGICYGMQTMAQQMGGRVEPSTEQEFGYARVRVGGESTLLEGIADEMSEASALLDVWMSHGDKVVEVPPGFVVTGDSDNSPVAAMENVALHLYALQFHPEVNHTLQGESILKRFAREICGCDGLWTPANIVRDIVDEVRARVGSDRVLLGLSGGVDSSVVAALLARAIGDQLTCVFVDNGLLRLHEREQVAEMFGPDTQNTFDLDLVVVDAGVRFLAALEGVNDPELKRKAIGNMFIEVFDEESTKIENVKYLAQGTIYPDVIESAGNKGNAHVIKSHHNVGGLPDDMALDLIEPLRELFKDEVRRIGLELGLSHDMVYRHPFPGPGLGVRILGEVTKAAADVLREADHIFIEELRRAGLYDRVSQAFAVYLPVSSVGVVGDQRRYAPVISLRAVETIDFMTARWAHLPYDFLERVSGRIINEIGGVSRVVYDISSKPPATIEWE